MFSFQSVVTSRYFIFWCVFVQMNVELYSHLTESHLDFFPSVFTVYQDYFALASFFCFTCSSSCFDTLFRFSKHAMQIIIEIIAFTLLVTILVLPYFEERTLWMR